MFDFYVSVARWSSETKIRLIDLGFSFLLIHDNVFLGCNHILSANDLFTRNDYLALTQHFQTNSTRNGLTKLITSMNSPEKLKILLDFYPNVDLGQLTPGNSELYQQRTPLTIFDRLLKMETFFYETHEHLVLDEHFHFESDRPNVRSANLLFLFEKLVEKQAKVIENRISTIEFRFVRLDFDKSRQCLLPKSSNSVFRHDIRFLSFVDSSLSRFCDHSVFRHDR